jgi:uncharacterized protein (DUF302 family)
MGGTMSEAYMYELESDKPFETVVENILKQVPERQFRVLMVHDVQQTLSEKGFVHDPLKIIEVCNARFAHQALGKDPNAALFMPCRYSVHGGSPKTIVKLGRPSMIARILSGSGLEGLATEVEETLMEIMRASV